MQQDVRQVIVQHGATPQPMLDPEGGVKQGIILLSRSQLEPNSREAVKGTELRPCDVRGIVPNQPATKRRPISQQRGEHEQSASDKITRAEAPGCPSLRRNLRLAGSNGFAWRLRLPGTASQLLSHEKLQLSPLFAGGREWR